MQDDSLNPYRPPDSTLEAVVIDTTSTWTSGRRIAAVMVLIGVGAYMAFVVILLLSTTQDRKAGILWCSNIPVFVIWLIMIAANKRRTFLAGYAAAVVQLMITAAMLVLGIGDVELVLMVNAGVCSAFVVLGIVCQQTGAVDRPTLG